MASARQVEATRTTTQLLEDLRDPANEPAWARVDARFRPVIAGLARRLGLNESEAEEAAQQSLAEFVRAYREGRYDRTKGRLSSWILGIAHHTSVQALRRSRRETAPGATAMAAVADESALRTIWEDERDRSILATGLDMLRDEAAVDDRTLRAFELTALRAVPASEAAAQCGMTVDQVYVARSRVTSRLRRIVEELTDAFEKDD